MLTVKYLPLMWLFRVQRHYHIAITQDRQAMADHMHKQG